jgi:hypothetical protein
MGQSCAHGFDFGKFRHVRHGVAAWSATNGVQALFDTIPFIAGRNGTGVIVRLMPIALVHLNDDVRERRMLVRDGSVLQIHADASGNQGGVVTISSQQGVCRLDNSSILKCLVNGVEIRRTTLQPGDRIEMGGQIYAVELITNATGAAAPVEGVRSSRRISAARLPVAVANDGRRGFLRRVGRMLQIRSQRATRLKGLEEERNQLLQDAGRCCLRPDAGIGLPEQAITDLQGRRRVEIRPEEVTAVHLEYWFRLRQRAVFLDAEIALLRDELGLGPDPEALADPTPTLRADHEQRQDRCFAALDDHDTQQLPADVDVSPSDQSAPRPTAPKSLTPPRIPIHLRRHR